MKLTCDERNEIVGNLDGWQVYASRTDLDGVYGEPIMLTVWEKDGRFIKDVRHPNPIVGEKDLEPCEHYEIKQEEL